MNIHEFQAKQLLGRHGVSVPSGELCTSIEQAKSVAERLFEAGFPKIVLKSQIHAGGRGKGTFKSGFRGGVHLCDRVDQACDLAKSMLGQVLVTRQTGPEGRQVNKLLIEAATPIRKELYAAVLLDRARSLPLLMASTEGGMDIEEVAAQTPERIVKESVDPSRGLMPFQARRVALKLGLKGELFSSAVRLLQGLYRTWWECDASLVEVNPLAIVGGPSEKAALVAVDAKMALDDNALFRHPDIQAMRDLSEEAVLEVEASRHNLNYIKLDGNIACLVNGAGLAMATMDIIQHYGGNPANFLDVGGGATREQVTAAFRIILSDPNVKAILVNIFGGIMQCDIIAAGIVDAVRETRLSLPLVVRLEGNNVESGKRILSESGLSLISGDSMADAARKVVQVAETGSR